MNPGNDHPEIPSFKPATGKEEEKKGTGIVPSSAKPAPSSGFKFPGFGGGSTGASKAFSSPNLKVRGLGGGGSTVMDRLKNLRKKDLIFIAAGLCTLGMAPLAEHLLMSPDDQSAKLQEGFNSQQGPLFQDGSSVYEPGNGVGSPGGLVGSGGDVITPLNVRDPSNLIMSPGAQKKADAVVAPPPTPSVPAKDDSDWKNALSGAARSGASKAAQQAPRPRPNVGKMAGAIRGLSALGGGGGGTGASLKLDALSARGVPNTAAGSNALTRSQATPGYRGATSRSGASSGAGEDLRAAGAKQSDIFNKGGGASAALDAASREAIPTGGAGSSGGRPGEGGETKNPGGNSHKDNKSLGESLAFLRQKMEMEKSLDLKWERKKWNEFGRQKMLEESALKLGFDMFGKFAEKAFIGPLGDMIGQSVAGSAAPAYVVCTTPQTTIPFSQIGTTYLFDKNLGTLRYKEGGAQAASGCRAIGGGGDAPNPGGGQYERPPTRLPGPPASDHAGRINTALSGRYNEICTKDKPGYLGDALCGQLSTMQGYVSTHMGKAESSKNEAQKTIGLAYTAMKTQAETLEKGSGGLANTVGVPPQGGGAVPAEAPLVKYLGNANPAIDNLKTPMQDETTALNMNNTAKESLTKAKTEGVDKAVGTGSGAPCGGQGGGTIKVACQARVDSTAQAGDITGNFTAAGQQIATAKQSIADGKAAVTGMTPGSGLAGGHIGTFESFKRDALAAFTGIEGVVATTERHKATAESVNTAKVVAAKAAHDAALTKVEAIFSQGAAADVVARVENWSVPMPGAAPVGKSAITAKQENYDAVKGPHEAVVTQEAPARQAVTGTVTPIKLAKDKVAECMTTFECAP